MTSKQIEEKDILLLENVCRDLCVVCVFIERIFTPWWRMQNNYNNWFHLAPHFLYNLQVRLFNHSYKNKQYWEHQLKDSKQKSALNRKQAEKQKTREKWLAKKTEMLVKLWVENLKLLNLPDVTRFGQELLTKYSLKAHQKQ